MLIASAVMPLSKLEELKIDEWNRTIDVNIRGFLHGIAAALPVMQRQGSGQIINLSSIGGHAVHPTAAVLHSRRWSMAQFNSGSTYMAR